MSIESSSWQIRGNSAKGCAAALRGMGLRSDSKDVLSRFAGPALVVVGEKDAITPPEKARAMAELEEALALAEHHVRKANGTTGVGVPMSEVRARLGDFDGRVLAGSPAEFGRLIADETAKWGKLIGAAKVRLE